MTNVGKTGNVVAVTQNCGCCDVVYVVVIVYVVIVDVVVDNDVKVVV